MPLPSISETLRLNAPVFIRKLKRRGSWEQESGSIADRAQSAAASVFQLEGQSGISLYFLATDDDFRRVMVGMNGNRDSLLENIDLLAIKPDELDAQGISVVATKGDLKCGHANKLHHDAHCSELQLVALCTKLMSSGRQAARCTRPMMKLVVSAAEEEHCAVVVVDSSCKVPACRA